MKARYGIASLLGILAIIVVPLYLLADGHIVYPPTDERLANIEGTLGIVYPTATSEATATQDAPTATVEPTATDVPPTATEPEHGDEPNHWHAAVGHEHGDAPQQWVTDWSLDQFGHGVIYGGDEQTPNEFAHKPVAFKGQIVRQYDPEAGGYVNNGAEGYVRYHGQANALGRCVRYHSFEFYWRDSAGNVTFRQGHVDFGDPATRRFPRADGDPGIRPAMLVNDSRTPNLFEQWYGRGAAIDIGVGIGNATTLFEAGECADQPEDLGPFNNNYGLTRLVDGVIYASKIGSFSGWICMNPAFYADATSSQYNPATGECGNPNHIPQYIAPTLVGDMLVSYGLNRLDFRSQTTFSCNACSLPN